jgi:Diacylglycerol acyltransferase
MATLRTAALLVYPGGDEESFRPSWESSTVAFAGRTGFVKLALEFGVPTVPVVALGGQETGLFLGRGRRIASALSLNRIARLKVVPPVLGPPFGITVLDFPGRIPLPSKITIRVMPPIDLLKKLGANGDVEEGYRLVTSRMQTHSDPASRPARSARRRITVATGITYGALTASARGCSTQDASWGVIRWLGAMAAGSRSSTAALRRSFRGCTTSPACPAPGSPGPG